MSQKIQGGSVFPNSRLSPSGPQLSGEGGPIVQIGFDQMIFEPPPGSSVYDLPFFAAPTPADVIGAKIPRNTSLPAGPDNVLGVTLRNVRRGNIVAAWFAFGLRPQGTNSGLASIQLCFDDGADGDPGIIGFALQQVNLTPDILTRELGPILTLGPSPYDEQRDVRIYPTALTDVVSVGRFAPPSNQVSLIVAEIAKT